MLFHGGVPESLTRKYAYRRRLPHYQKTGRPIFVTFCKLDRTAVFSAAARDIVLQHCLHDDGKKMRLHAAVVMPDHVHLLLTLLEDQHGWPYALAAVLKLIKGISARRIHELSLSSGPVWQEESFDHMLRSNESFDQKLEYIRQNPVRRGLAARPEDYRWLWIEPRRADTLIRLV